MYPEDRKYLKTHDWVRIEGNILTIGMTWHAVRALKGINYVYVNDFVSDSVRGKIVYEPGLELQPLTEEDLQDPEVKKSKRFLGGKVVTEIDASKGFVYVYSPVRGKIIEMNDRVNEKDENEIPLIDRDPYGEGWIAKIEIAKPDSLSPLMTAKEYQEYLLEG